MRKGAGRGGLAEDELVYGYRPRHRDALPRSFLAADTGYYFTGTQGRLLTKIAQLKCCSGQEVLSTAEPPPQSSQIDVEG